MNASGRNQTKVGLKDQALHAAHCDKARRNQTKVGLKASDLGIAWLGFAGRNQTKVGLKVSEAIGANEGAVEEIRPRWD
ncbi:MAG: hypothetical protein OD814_001533 [Candidatus Alkanophagales archaeon MCA70_species_1]|nr:hypothetical protein [Candidatus Alkanophaga volatiphilum]